VAPDLGVDGPHWYEQAERRVAGVRSGDRFVPVADVPLRDDAFEDERISAANSSAASRVVKIASAPSSGIANGPIISNVPLARNSAIRHVSGGVPRRFADAGSGFVE